MSLLADPPPLFANGEAYALLAPRSAATYPLWFRAGYAHGRRS